MTPRARITSDLQFPPVFSKRNATCLKPSRSPVVCALRLLPAESALVNIRRLPACDLNGMAGRCCVPIQLEVMVIADDGYAERQIENDAE